MIGTDQTLKVDQVTLHTSGPGIGRITEVLGPNSFNVEEIF